MKKINEPEKHDKIVQQYASKIKKSNQFLLYSTPRASSLHSARYTWYTEGVKEWNGVEVYCKDVVRCTYGSETCGGMEKISRKIAPPFGSFASLFFDARRASNATLIFDLK